MPPHPVAYPPLYAPRPANPVTFGLPRRNRTEGRHPGPPPYLFRRDLTSLSSLKEPWPCWAPNIFPGLQPLFLTRFFLRPTGPVPSRKHSTNPNQRPPDSKWHAPLAHVAEHARIPPFCCAHPFPLCVPCTA